MNNWITILLLCLLTSFAFAEETDFQQAQLSEYHFGVTSLNSLRDSGIITSAQYTEGISHYTSLADEINEKYSTADALLHYEAQDTRIVQTELTLAQKVVGFMSFMNFLFVLFGIIGVVSVVVLFGDIIISLVGAFALLPMVFYEAILYLMSAALLGSGFLWDSQWTIEMAFIGALLLAGAMILSAHLRDIEPNLTRFFGVLFIVYTPLAIFYNTELLGFLSVASLMGVLGFSIAVYPGCYAFGFNRKSDVGRATGAAFIMLTVFVCAKIAGTSPEHFHPFMDSAFMLGGFVGFLGLLISSSKWYEDGNYLIHQVVAIITATLVIGIGFIFDIGELQKGGGTFICLYILEKSTEIPIQGMRAWAIWGLILSCLMYLLYGYVNTNPEVVSQFVYGVTIISK